MKPLFSESTRISLLPLDGGNISLLAMLDLSAAFDCVDHDVFLLRLHHNFGLGTPIVDWLQSYLTGRVQRVKFHTDMYLIWKLNPDKMEFIWCATSRMQHHIDRHAGQISSLAMRRLSLGWRCSCWVSHWIATSQWIHHQNDRCVSRTSAERSVRVSISYVDISLFVVHFLSQLPGHWLVHLSFLVVIIIKDYLLASSTSRLFVWSES